MAFRAYEGLPQWLSGLTILSYQTNICGEDQVALGNRLEERTLNTVITAINKSKVGNALSNAF